MKVGGVPYRAIFTGDDGTEVRVIDQTVLPHRFETIRLETAADAAHAIRDMVVRGAPLIGATAAYGVALAMRADPSDGALNRAIAQLAATRPTAVNLRWALDAAGALLRGLPPGERETAAYAFAARLCEDDVRTNRSIGQFGLQIFRHIARQAGAGGDGSNRQLNIMTHCNAGWLATVDWGTATAPIYRAHDQGLRVHVWVRETRPRFQGAGQRCAVLRGGPVTEHRLVDRRRRRDPDRRARRGRGDAGVGGGRGRGGAVGAGRAGRDARRELCLRRDAEAAGDGVGDGAWGV